jgi:hypothetical protein
VADDTSVQATVDLFDPEHQSKWHPTPGHERSRPWNITAGVAEGFNSWIAHPETFGDFVLDVEIRFSGKGEGGIVIRGDHRSREPWASGYELDVDWHAGHRQGHVHYPVKPKPYGGAAVIDVDRWHRVRIEAVGSKVTTFLDGTRVLAFEDVEHAAGQICLEGHSDGVRYRNLRVTPLNVGAGVETPAAGGAMDGEAGTARKPLPKVTLRREGRRVWLDGAKEVFHRHFEDKDAGRTVPWAERCDTYMYLAHLRAVGVDVDYATLNVVAGYATSFTYDPRPDGQWGRHYWPIDGRDERIAHAIGQRYRWHRHATPEDYWQALKRSIDEGQPVHAPFMEDVLFIGYVDAGKPDERKVMPVAIVFVDQDEWTWERFVRWHGQFGGWFGRWEGQVDPWPARQSAIEVIETLVRVARGDDPRGKQGDGVVYGIAGVEAYATDLADMSRSGAAEDDGGYFQGGWRGCHNVYPQISGRPAAAKYLRRIATHFEGETREQIETAAAAYDRATEAWTAYLAQLGGHAGRTVGVDHVTAWTTGQYRRAGAAAVARAAEHERAAVAALEQALATTEEAKP